MYMPHDGVPFIISVLHRPTRKPKSLLYTEHQCRGKTACVCAREKERETDRQTDRLTDRQTDSQTDRQTD